MSDLISRCELFNRLAPVQTLGEAYGIIQEMPTVDAISVVRCRDCKYAYLTVNGECKYCDIWFPDEAEYVDGDYYCASGERKDGDHHEG